MGDAKTQMATRYLFLTKWGSEGKADGQLTISFCLALDSLGYVYVSDSGNHRIQVFSPI
jgi:NHL repeat